jgi:hypothetical protein
VIITGYFPFSKKYGIKVCKVPRVFIEQRKINHLIEIAVVEGAIPSHIDKMTAHDSGKRRRIK